MFYHTRSVCRVASLSEGRSYRPPAGCEPERRRDDMLTHPASDPISESGREETKHTSYYVFGETQERAAEAGEKKATRDLTDLSAGFPAADFSAVRAVAGGSESSLFV